MKIWLLIAIIGWGMVGCSTYDQGYYGGAAGNPYQTGASSGGSAGFETIAPNRASPALPGNSTSGSFPIPVIPLFRGTSSPRP